MTVWGRRGDRESTGFKQPAPGPHRRVFLRPDADIRDEILRDVLDNHLGTNPVRLDVDVRHGVVAVTGEVERKSMIRLVLPLVRAVDGVADATADLSYAVGGTRPVDCRVDDVAARDGAPGQVRPDRWRPDAADDGRIPRRGHEGHGAHSGHAHEGHAPRP